MKTKKTIPRFLSEEEEREFWSKHDTVDFIDWNHARRERFPKLKPSLRPISIRLPESLIDQLKVIANKKDVPYQSLVKTWLAEKLKEELKGIS